MVVKLTECVLPQVKEDTKGKLPQTLVRKEMIIMNVSEIGQNMPMPRMYGMGPPSPSDMASRVIDDLDTNGDGVLSADEISKGSQRAQRILDADANDDGSVTKDELISKITEDMENMEGFPGLPDGEQPDINQLKSILAQVGTEQSDESNQSATDLLTQILSQLNLSDDEIKTVLEMMQSSGVSVTA